MRVINTINIISQSRVMLLLVLSLPVVGVYHMA